MFSRRMFKMAAFIAKLSRKFGASILYFNETEELFNNDFSVMPLVKRNYYGLVIWLLLSTFSIIEHYVKGNVDKYTLACVYWIAGVLMLSSLTVPYWFAQDFCRILNGTIIFYKFMHEKFMPDFDEDTSKLNIFIETFALSYNICIHVMTVMALIFCAYDTRSEAFLGGLIPEEYFYFPIRLAVIIFHSYILITIGFNLIFNGNFIIVALFYTTTMLGELRPGKRKQYRTLNTLRTSFNIRHVYRSFQVFHANCMALLGRFIFVSHGIIMVELIIGSFTLIRYWDVLKLELKAPIVVGVPTLTTFWSFVLGLGGIFSIKGAKLLKSWKGRSWGHDKTENKIMKKFHKSCFPLLLAYGKQFVITRTTFTTFASGITRSTQKALLASK